MYAKCDNKTNRLGKLDDNANRSFMGIPKKQDKNSKAKEIFFKMQ